MGKQIEAGSGARAYNAAVPEPARAGRQAAAVGAAVCEAAVHMKRKRYKRARMVDCGWATNQQGRTAVWAGSRRYDGSSKSWY